MGSLGSCYLQQSLCRTVQRRLDCKMFSFVFIITPHQPQSRTTTIMFFFHSFHGFSRCSVSATSEVQTTFWKILHCGAVTPLQAVAALKPWTPQFKVRVVALKCPEDSNCVLLQIEMVETGPVWHNLWVYAQCSNLPDLRINQTFSVNKLGACSVFSASYRPPGHNIFLAA